MLRKLEEREKALRIAKFLAKKGNVQRDFSIMDIARKIDSEEHYPEIRYIVLQMEKGGLVSATHSIYKKVRVSVRASKKLKKANLTQIRLAI